MQIAIFRSTSAQLNVLREPLYYSLPGDVYAIREKPGASIASLASFAKTGNRLKIFYKIETAGESIYFHKCKDPPVNRYDLTADQRKTGIGYCVPCVGNKVGQWICARRCETGNTGYAEWKLRFLVQSTSGIGGVIKRL